MRRVIAGALCCAASGCFGTQDFGVGELMLDAGVVPTAPAEDGSRGAPADAALPPREEDDGEDDDDNRNLIAFDAAMNAPTDAGASDAGALADAADAGRDGAADAAADAAREASVDASADASRDASSDDTMDAARNPLCVIEPWHCL